MIIAGSPFNSAPPNSTNSVLTPINAPGNLRIVYNNVADLAELTASSTNSLSINNVKTEYKGEIHRSIGTSVSYTLEWAADQIVGCVCLPCTNLSYASTIRIKFYDSLSILREDTGDLVAVSGATADTSTNIYNANNFAYGGIAKSVVWFPSRPDNIRSIVIELTDAGNSAGYIDNSRIVVGDYWESMYNLDKGMQYHSIDSSTTSISNAGSLVTERGFIRDKISLSLSLIPEADRASLVGIIRSVGVHKNFLLSMFPGTYNSYENDFLIYGKRSNSPITNILYGYYKHDLEVISW